jgi:hypothetical protein
MAMVAAARDARCVDGLTHAHYRYPARFSPILARTAIELFTEPGDLVIDPFVGGGTTCVEALASGRKSVGTDISSLATFVAEAKTTIPNEAALARLTKWSHDLSKQISARGGEPKFDEWSEAGYLKHLGGHRWPLRRAIAQAVNEVQELDVELHNLGRLVILRTAQQALDGRRVHSGLAEFRTALSKSGEKIAAGSSALARSAGDDPQRPLILNRTCIGVEQDALVQPLGKARLVLTSPPYPGVHVLYHRWQVGGGKETAAPFFIANQLDGSGEAYYTMGGRSVAGVRSYFAQLKQALASISELADKDTTFVQVVAFSEPAWQLAQYLSAAAELGLQELGLRSLSGVGDGRLWREVPNRRWYNSQRNTTPSAQEVVLFHRLSRD